MLFLVSLTGGQTSVMTSLSLSSLLPKPPIIIVLQWQRSLLQVSL